MIFTIADRQPMASPLVMECFARRFRWLSHLPGLSFIERPHVLDLRHPQFPRVLRSTSRAKHTRNDVTPVLVHGIAVTTFAFVCGQNSSISPEHFRLPSAKHFHNQRWPAISRPCVLAKPNFSDPLGRVIIFVPSTVSSVFLLLSIRC